MRCSCLVTRWMCAPAWLSPFFSLVVSHGEFGSALAFLLLQPTQSLCPLSIYQKASKRARPQESKRKSDHILFSTCPCVRWSMSGSHIPGLFWRKEIPMEGGITFVYRHTWQMWRRAVIDALFWFYFVRWIPSFDEELNIFQMCWQF